MALAPALPPTGETVIELDGELNMATVQNLVSRLDGLDGDIVLDCHGVTFLDTVGIDALLGAHWGCETRGDRLIVRGLSDHCRRLVALVSADQVLHIEQ